MSKNVLVLAAHPDDETLGCGATIARLSNEGHNVQLLTFTNGVGARGEVGDRNDVLGLVQNILGLNSYSYGSFPDNEMDSVSLLSICKFIESNVSVIPDFIFTHHNGCLNIDHQIVYRATMTVFRPQLGDNIQIYSYYVPSSTDYNPYNNFNGNVYFDVGEYKDIKLECLKQCYDEEMREYPHTRSYENVENLMKVWGAEVGLKYAEKFKLVREIL
jgi:LmbE family N-acetylglucosaminyl deacetylase